ncbi:hypothetical protein SDRG_07298 [Saprolegnia diclina VS20]|uniref:RING-type domain-containing protein n=1 Tax=Saprolegnia diclina (strain VS20) TaxID=1156394 RepID=T0QMM1_SAPDV|nr:hypothetical protein SDRG_07298 [Saprolegnia diclina VS20]EQC35060.1 hypothetical protein SDRG_07298 [Saprolegnia diclina VS20]|eukprot:XP_008611344.1 hypothetical protein SDRG_07298 [Saprolegnia diclina VS20]
MKSTTPDLGPRVHSLGATLVLTCTKGNVAGSDAFMSYRLVVVDPRTKVWWILNRRYSHFFALRQRLKEIATTGHAALKSVVAAAFPRRRFVFAVDNKSVVDERLRGLPAFTAELARWLPAAESSGAYGPSYLVATFLQLPYRWSAAPAKVPHECAICLDPLGADASLSTACGHTFHETCLVRWFKNETTCPLCRSIALHGSVL